MYGRSRAVIDIKDFNTWLLYRPRDKQRFGIYKLKEVNTDRGLVSFIEKSTGLTRDFPTEDLQKLVMMRRFFPAVFSNNTVAHPQYDGGGGNGAA